jgi:serine/threonine protein kinase
MDDPVWENVSSHAKDLVRKLLVVDPESRIKAKDI